MNNVMFQWLTVSTNTPQMPLFQHGLIAESVYNPSWQPFHGLSFFFYPPPQYAPQAPVGAGPSAGQPILQTIAVLVAVDAQTIKLTVCGLLGGWYAKRDQYLLRKENNLISIGNPCKPQTQIKQAATFSGVHRGFSSPVSHLTYSTRMVLLNIYIAAVTSSITLPLDDPVAGQGVTMTQSRAGGTGKEQSTTGRQRASLRAGVSISHCWIWRQPSSHRQDGV